jgi:hypothetical protein
MIGIRANGTVVVFSDTISLFKSGPVASDGYNREERDQNLQKLRIQGYYKKATIKRPL